MSGGGGAVVAIAAAARARRIREVVNAFRVADATGPERARTLDALAIDPSSREARRLAEAGVLLPGRESGSWYLAEAGYAEYQDARRRRRTMLVSAVVVGSLVVALASRFAVRF